MFSRSRPGVLFRRSLDDPSQLVEYSMQQRSAHPPTPSDLTHLRPSNTAGALVILGALGATTIAIALALRTEWWLWLTGQLILALALVQWFAILHECGHETLF